MKLVTLLLEHRTDRQVVVTLRFLEKRRKEKQEGKEGRKEGTPEGKFCCRWVTLGDMRHHDNALSPFLQKGARKGK
jgi:hypothetical protein